MRWSGGKDSEDEGDRQKHSLWLGGIDMREENRRWGGLTGKDAHCGGAVLMCGKRLRRRGVGGKGVQWGGEVFDVRKEAQTIGGSSKGVHCGVCGEDIDDREEPQTIERGQAKVLM